MYIAHYMLYIRLHTDSAILINTLIFHVRLIKKNM